MNVLGLTGSYDEWTIFKSNLWFLRGQLPGNMPRTLAGQSVGKDRQPDSLIRSYCIFVTWIYLLISLTGGRLYIYLNLENLYFNIPRTESSSKYFWFRHPKDISWWFDVLQRYLEYILKFDLRKAIGLMTQVIKI